jgi:hypothetical protein
MGVELLEADMLRKLGNAKSINTPDTETIIPRDATFFLFALGRTIFICENPPVSRVRSPILLYIASA